MINVKDLLKRFTTEELNQKAEEYFARIDDRIHLLAKPFAKVEECSKIFFSFAEHEPRGLAPAIDQGRRGGLGVQILGARGVPTDFFRLAHARRRH